jgi:hypothetical protein
VEERSRVTVVWEISKKDVTRVRTVVERQKKAPIVLERLERNLAPVKPSVSKEGFWQILVSCLLTTQRRSGPEGAVARFNRATPFALGLAACARESDVQAFAARTLSAFGGIRRSPTLAIQSAENLERLEGGLWPSVQRELRRLIGRKIATRATEVEVADFIDDSLVGFGPKQARNLLQWLGLTRYEIPRQPNF